MCLDGVADAEVLLQSIPNQAIFPGLLTASFAAAGRPLSQVTQDTQLEHTAFSQYNQTQTRSFHAGTLAGTQNRVGLSPNVSVPVIRENIQLLADAIFRFLFNAPTGAIASDLLSVQEDFVREALGVLQEPRGVPNFQGLARASNWVGKVLESRAQV